MLQCRAHLALQGPFDDFLKQPSQASMAVTFTPLLQTTTLTPVSRGFFSFRLLLPLSAEGPPTVKLISRLLSLAFLSAIIFLNIKILILNY